MQPTAPRSPLNISLCKFDENVHKRESMSYPLNKTNMNTLFSKPVLYTNIDQARVNSLHELLNCEIGGLDCRVITTKYKTLVHCIHM